MVLAAAVVLCLVVTPAARADSPCSQAPASGGHTMHLGGRYVLLHVPRGIPSRRRVPLVVALHGAWGNGGAMEHYSGFSHAADLHGFVVVYPTASGPFWNFTASPSGADDVAFVDRVITDVQQLVCIDSRRVFATGVSNGGGMTALLGCALSARLAAIAPVAGEYRGQPLCRNKRPVSVLEIHGTADQVAPYFGGGGNASAQGPPPLVRGWVHRDGCQRSASVTNLASHALMYAWPGCAGGARVEHIRIVGGKHQWPGALPPDPGPRSTFCGACEIWSFFSTVSLDPGSSNGGVGLQG